jgi:quercetin dioxygenase-like cupin family protein
VTTPGTSVLLDGEATGGAFCVLRLVLEPGGGAGWHAHTREDETLVLTAGGLIVETDDGAKGLERGQVVYLPRNVRHAFHAGEEGASVLVFAVPAGLEQFFRALDAGADPDEAAAAAGISFG